MKILLISDIHANIQALESVLKAETDWDLLVCAGDYVDYGTSPAEVVDLLRSLPKPHVLVLGNHDAHLVRTYRSGEYRRVEGHDYKWVHYDCSLLHDEQVDWIAALPRHATFEADGWTYLVQHQYQEGSYAIIEQPTQFKEFWNKHAASGSTRERMVFGHSHRQCMYLMDGCSWINPGSISYRRPDDPAKDAQYMTITDGVVAWKHVGYDRSVQFAVAKRFHERDAMMETELQDFWFFFGDAPTSRSPLPPRHEG
ncbi:MAG: metallophosphoesterase family protein [Sphaerochaetaceae bacterium]|nr:metallophosphoesterase family protein [Sphaerochaetaceae bacterium]